jgi:two-component system, OmpR family, alkaline phosphatase synthesis response regulator PhoP
MKMDREHGSVLVVEDDREINSLVGAYAEICGFEYRPALDGTTALREAERKAPDAVILDLMLPDVDGFEVCRRLRDDLHLTEVPIIILSALSGEKEIARGKECGADEYLTKPFNPDVLIKTLMGHVKQQAH